MINNVYFSADIIRAIRLWGGGGGERGGEGLGGGKGV